jgi:anti-anti-sigma factor
VEVKQSQQGAITLLELSGRLIGGPHMYALHDRIKQLIKDGSVDLLFDFSGVTMIDSFGLGIMLACHHSLEREGGTLRLCSLSEVVRDVFYITLISKVISIYPTRADAMAAFHVSGE